MEPSRICKSTITTLACHGPFLSSKAAESSEQGSNQTTKTPSLSREQAMIHEAARLDKFKHEHKTRCFFLCDVAYFIAV